MKIENYLPALQDELGEDLSLHEWIPGVYEIEARQGEGFPKEYFAVLDTAPIAGKVRNYGRKMDGLRLYAREEAASGWHIVQYETNKYSITVKKEPVTEWMFRDMSLHAMELYPEYFGAFPVPFQTPWGYTLRHWPLANGIYWLETSECRELLAVCYPVWSAELSAAAALCGQVMDKDEKEAAPYRFFPKRLSCVPLYELMQTRSKWDGTVIDLRSLMNAVWKYVPAYAMRLNGQPVQGDGFALLNLIESWGFPVMPEPDGKNVIGMFPEVGTDFLLLE